MKAAAVLALVLAAVPAHADDKPPPNMAKVRDLLANGDYEGGKRELLKLYATSPHPQILFALGQVELNLGNYQAAIDYYEKFIATQPNEKEIALAQQAIGAARMRLSEPKPDPVPEPDPIAEPTPLPQPEPAPEGNRWTLTHTGLVAFGGAAVLLGTGLLLYSRSLGNDRSGSLSTYDGRVDQAHTTRWTGVGIAATGALLVGVTLVW